MSRVPYPQEIGITSVDRRLSEIIIVILEQVPGCAHKDPIFEESVVAGDKGELANVVVSIKAPQGKELKDNKPMRAARAALKIETKRDGFGKGASSVQVLVAGS